MKKLIAISAIAALATVSSANGDVQAQLDALKAQIKQLEAKLKKQEKTVKKVVKTVKKVNKKANEAKMLANNDNLKWNVDFRTAVDKITYTHVNGEKSTNDSLLTNRLWMDFAYAPTENMSFYGRLSYLKAFGAETQNNQRDGGNATFDWLTNENAHGDNNLRVKQAYWLYRNDTFLDNDVSWTASIGRRPSTDGMGINLREFQDRQSALAHTVNVEFDGASFRWNIDKVTPLTGAWVKLCMGRGVTNAKPRFTADGTDYSTDNTQHFDSNMVGFIFVPYDDGQYSLHMNYAKATNLIGYGANPLLGFKEFGDMEYFTAAVVAEGVGSGISDYLDDTRVFLSYAQSTTDPNNGINGSMLGSADSETGHSWWIGANVPCPITDDGRIGVEWNKGSKYWRSMTYGEDTMVGSKIAARGTAWEVYYHKPLVKGLDASIRYTKIDYDYTGSNGFFGSYSAPTEIDSAPGSAVKEAEDIRAYLRYRF